MKLNNGFKSECHVSSLALDQPTLFDVEPSSTPEPVEEQINYTRLKKQHHGRNQLQEHLPIKEVIIEPEQDVQDLTKIGE